MQQVSIQSSTGYGLYGINVFDVHITDASFAANNLYTNFNGTYGSNVLLGYLNTEKCPNTFNQYHVSFGDFYGTLVGVSGLGVYMEQAGSIH